MPKNRKMKFPVKVKKKRIPHAAIQAVAAILLRSRGVFPFVKRRKNNIFPGGSIMMRRGTRMVMKTVNVPISVPMHGASSRLESRPKKVQLGKRTLDVSVGPFRLSGVIKELLRLHDNSNFTYQDRKETPRCQEIRPPAKD